MVKRSRIVENVNLGIVATLIVSIFFEFIDKFITRYILEFLGVLGKIDSNITIIIMLILLNIIIVLMFYQWWTEREQGQVETIDDFRKNIDALKDKNIQNIADLKDDHTQHVDAIREKHVALVDELKQSHAATIEKLKIDYIERAGILGKDFEHLSSKINSFILELDKITDNNVHIWGRPILTKINMIPVNERNTRFISIFNLKGGVGKSTLTGNLGAVLVKKGFKVLIVDLDFQYTLSERVINQQVRKQITDKNFTAKELLRSDPSDDLVGKLAVPAEGIEGLKIIASYEDLEAQDFACQVKFIWNPDDDVRFRYRKIFSTISVLGLYDFVLFDCPPRSTTSVINAIACSDHVLIPTKLGQDSTNAIERTINWLRKLSNIHNATVLGIVINEVQWHGNAPLVAYRSLADQLKQRYPNEHLFNIMVKHHVSLTNGENIQVLTEPKVMEFFEQLTSEFINKVKKHEHK